MAKQEYPYPEDEYDVQGAGRVPEGVHRAPVPRWRILLPFVIVLVLAPALAYAGVRYLSDPGGPSPAVSPTSTVTTAPAEPEPTPEETPSVEPTPEAPPEGDVRRDAAVFLLNGTTNTGLGSAASAALAEDGFTAVSTSGYSRPQPSGSTVYYNSAELADTAQRVATVLQIGQVVELASATDSIAVVLRSDFTP